MKKTLTALVLTACALTLSAPAMAKKAAKPAQDQQQTQQSPDNDATPPRYTPFPHDQNFVLKEINGKTPPVDMWLRIDSTGRANGFSGCKNWSGVFAIGPDRLGPRAMPAINEQKCEGPLQAIEHEYWGILLSGPHWDTRGDDLILKGTKGGSMRFSRSL
jgi:heat shock protein HslJ